MLLPDNFLPRVRLLFHQNEQQGKKREIFLSSDSRIVTLRFRIFSSFLYSD